MAGNETELNSVCAHNMLDFILQLLVQFIKARCLVQINVLQVDDSETNVTSLNPIKRKLVKSID